MSSAKLSVSAVFGALGATAAATTTTVNTLASIVDMGAAYVREAAINLQVEQVIDRDAFVDKLTTEKAAEKLKRDAEIARLCSDPEVLKQFTAAKEYYTQLIDAHFGA